MIRGFASEEGTAKFAKNSNANSKNFCIAQALTLSNVGIGTYLGQPDTETDQLVKKAIKMSINAGINVIRGNLRSDDTRPFIFELQIIIHFLINDYNIDINY
ncbi:MAG: hypothetical protein IH795_05120 [Bacteroidetes bacterium]|nr:hypothetical protein [Bacteroidota bacterium]